MHALHCFWKHSHWFLCVYGNQRKFFQKVTHRGRHIRQWDVATQLKATKSYFGKIIEEERYDKDKN